ncbi:MAG: hypothetical protein KF745_10640 [Phycisphaeraceae bacterium]|nr:hypothetical protein [Phycisphaeraceae bacterium]
MSMRRAFPLIVGLSLAAAANADIVTQWDFNTPSPGDGNNGTGILTPNLGSGLLTPIGGITASFASGDATGGSSDPNVGDDSAYNTTSYPAQGTASGTAGVRFDVSTAGFSGISVAFDLRHSNTSSRFIQFQYSLDGSTFITAGLAGDGIFEANSGGDFWYNLRSVDLSSIAAADNNPAFAFRFVSIFDPSAGNAYSAATATSSYAGSGTLRYDMVTVNAVPAPGAAALVVAGGIVATRRRRR